MTKQEFIAALRTKLSGVPEQDMEERLEFYSEMIDDRIEEGISEEEAVAAIGSVDAVATQILADIPLRRIAKERIKPKRRLKTREIVLFAVGSPVWLALAIAALAVVFSLYVAVWAVDVALWAVFAAFAAGACGGAGVTTSFFVGGNVPGGLLAIGASAVCAGLAIFAFFGCRAATKGAVYLTKKIALLVKRCFTKKEEA